MNRNNLSVGIRLVCFVLSDTIHIKGGPHSWAAFVVCRKPLARRVVQKKTNVDNGKRKTPFAILEVRSANCTSKQREVIRK